MIVIQMTLQSAISRSWDSDLGTVIIGNDGTSEDPSRGNYDVRAYPKGRFGLYKQNGFEMWKGAKPSRTARVERHRRLAEPVGNLVAKALAALGYA